MKRYRRSFWEAVQWRLYGKWHKKLLKRRANHKFQKALEAAPAGSLAIDCGANVGDVTEQLIRHGLRVIAYEPEPMAIDIFQRRFGDNDNVTLHKCAVGASAGTVQLHRSSRAATDIVYTQTSSLFPFEHLEGSLAINVQVIDIVQAIREIKDHIYLLKLDIEGSEADVLEALLDAGLTESIDHIFVETHERFGVKLKAQIDGLRNRIAENGHQNIDLNWG